MYERFGEPLRAVMVEALHCSVELGSPRMGVGHLLYGCAAAGDATAGVPLRDAGIAPASIRGLLAPPGRQPDAEALRAVGIDYEQVHAAVDRTFGPGALEAAPDRRRRAGLRRRPPLTPEAKRALELAQRVAVELHQRRTVPGHLLLGLLRLDDELVSSVLAESGTSIAALSAAALERLSESRA